MREYHKSFAGRLTKNILLVVFAVFLSTMVFVAVYSNRLISEEAGKSATNLLDATIKDIEKTLQAVEMVVSSEASLAYEMGLGKDEFYNMTRRTVADNTDIIGSAIAFRSGYFAGRHFFSPYSYIDGETGEIRSKQLGREDYDYFYLDWYLIPSMLGTPVWSEPYYDEGGVDELISTYSLPLKDDDGEVFAVLTADVALDWLSKKVSSIKPYPSSQTILISRSGAFVAADNLSDLKGETIFSICSRFEDKSVLDIAKAIVDGKDGMYSFRNHGHTVFAIVGHLSNGWGAATICTYKDILATTTEMRVVMLILCLIGMILIFLVCHSMINKITRPLKDFSKSANQIAGGDFDTPLPEIESEDEIRVLRDSFEGMEHSLARYIEDLKSTTAANERFESELNIAREIQMSMVPHTFPSNDKLLVYADLVPAKEVGGDLYDCVLRGEWLYFAIGDVSGKGVPSSLVMAITRSAFRFISGLDLGMDEVMSKINDSVTEGNERAMFVTMFIGKLNLVSGELRFCNAGHNPPILVSPDGRAEYLNVKSNIAAGLFSGYKYEEQVVMVPHGGKILVYTDGVTEAENAGQDQFGEKRLLDWAVKAASEDIPAEDAVRHLFRTIKDFTGDAVQNDDITIMALELK